MWGPLNWLSSGRSSSSKGWIFRYVGPKTDGSPPDSRDDRAKKLRRIIPQHLLDQPFNVESIIRIILWVQSIESKD